MPLLGRLFRDAQCAPDLTPRASDITGLLDEVVEQRLGQLVEFVSKPRCRGQLLDRIVSDRLGGHGIDEVGEVREFRHSSIIH